MSKIPPKPSLDELAHYGVKGMKWGVVNEDKGSSRKSSKAQDKKDPKPIKDVSPEKQAKREAKAQKFEAQGKILDTRIKELKSEKYDGALKEIKNQQRNKNVQQLEKYKKETLDDAERTRQGRLTSNQKKALIGAGVVAGFIAYKVIEANVQSGEFNRLAAKGAGLFGPEFAFKQNAGLARKMNPDEAWDVARKVNPDFGALGTKMNCRRCTFAYEMRRRGFDVEATRTTNASGQNVIGLLNALSPEEKLRRTGSMSATSQLIKADGDPNSPITKLMGMAAGARTKIDSGHPVDIFDALSREPSGSRGELGVMWSFGGGHSMAYEIFNGQPVIFDAQTGKRYTSAASMVKEMKIDSAGFTRLDNVELNTDYLLRWLKNAR